MESRYLSKKSNDKDTSDGLAVQARHGANANVSAHRVKASIARR
ncbi:hypothetical protein [Chromohalobacter canadensis]|uniref:Uncharacterized protein n=1 Tax=Chromohalobacter canadensis TaxID=141389 RepID=A0ABZ0YAZ4_9GAMM|nr:hypothetical protein [Chromohalobacter canadensis]WQH09023.1 hypothetical protein SR908_16390 [Chromohalobacter canadensis]